MIPKTYRKTPCCANCKSVDVVQNMASLYFCNVSGTLNDVLVKVNPIDPLIQWRKENMVSADGICDYHEMEEQYGT